MRVLASLLLWACPSHAMKVVTEVPLVRPPINGSAGALTPVGAYSGIKLDAPLAATLNFQIGLPSWKPLAAPQTKSVSAEASLAAPAAASLGSNLNAEASRLPASVAAPTASNAEASSLVPTSRLGGGARLGVNAELGGASDTSDKGDTGKNLRVGSDQFSAALGRLSDQSNRVAKLLDEGGRPEAGAEAHTAGLSIFDTKDLWRERPPQPKRSSNGWDWEVAPQRAKPLGDRNSQEVFSRALSDYGIPQPAVQKMVRRLPEIFKYNDPEAYHGMLHAVRSANLMAQFLEHVEREERLGHQRTATPSDKANLVMAALLHRVDGYSGRPKGTSPNLDGTDYFLRDDPYLGSIFGDMRYGGAPIFPDHLNAYVRHTYEPHKPYQATEEWEAWREIDTIYRRGFGRYWGDRLSFIGRAAMFVDSPEFAREAVRARARELRRDAEAAGKGPGPSDDEVFLAAAVELKALTEHLVRLSLPDELQANLWAVRSDFEEIARRITQAGP